MKLKQLTPILLLIPMAIACAGENALARVEQSCIKYPTPEARADSEKVKKSTMDAFESEKKAEQKKATEAGGPDQKKRNDLCFTRQATGEVVCPN